MLYTDTDLFFFHFFLKNLIKEINARAHFWDAFDLCEISPKHLFNLGRSNAELHDGEVGYFKDETKSNPIVEFVYLRLKMHLFRVCDASKRI